MTVSILVNKLDNSFVARLLEPTMKRCFAGDLRSNVGKVISCPSITFKSIYKD